MGELVVTDSEYFIFVAGAITGLSVGFIANIWVTTKFKLIELYPWSKNYKRYQDMYTFSSVMLWIFMFFLIGSLAYVIST